LAQQRYEEAEHQLREALKIYRQRGVRDARLIFALGVMQNIFALSGRDDEAERVIDQAWAALQDYDTSAAESASETALDVINYCGDFACYFAATGKPQKAADFLQRAALAAERLRDPVESVHGLTGLAIVRLRLGDKAGYQKECAKLVRLARRVVDDELRLGCIRVSCFGPNGVEDPNLLVKLAQEFAANNSLGTPYIDRAVLGTAHYRAGQYEQAAQCLNEAIAKFPSDAPPSHGPDLVRQLLLAMTKWQLGEQDEARRMLREFKPRLDESLQSPWIYWDHRAVLEIRRQEAEALIKPKEADEGGEKEIENSDDP
jgi:tetratricopeptide (TPR) repeat protein